MGCRKSVPYNFDYKVRILVAGNHPCVWDADRLINKFVYNSYEFEEPRNKPVPYDLITVPVGKKRVNLDIKNIVSLMGEIEEDKGRFIKTELFHNQLVGLMLLYEPINPTPHF